MAAGSLQPSRALAPFNTSYAIEAIRNMTGITVPPNINEAFANGYLTKEEYESIKEAYRKSNESAAQALVNAEAADKWFKEYDANMSTTRPLVQTSSPIVIQDGGTSAPSNPALSRDGGVSSPNSNTASIVGLVLGAVATIGLLAGAIVYAKRRRQHSARHAQRKGRDDMDEETTGSSTAYSRLNRRPPSTSNDDESSSSLWNDDSLLAVRVPLENLHRDKLVSSGGFGEVYRGTYKGGVVAIKSLLGDKRKDVAQIKSFLAEIKLMATLDHPRIVQFIGVAWEALSDLCVVTEFMDGGDLRSLLQSFAESQRPRGFDRDKIQIALHIAHALTYLHSLQPIILHRDLKSRNILLDSAWQAKLTDFGVSRERSDATMTAGIGSSLWMAPEVMLGERYDEKSDVFSFGVVLSELDTHQLPYADAREEGTGRPIPQTAVLQLVSLGRLSVSLTSNDTFPELQLLVRDCVALDPTLRPTAAEVLHRVHQMWRPIASG